MHKNYPEIEIAYLVFNEGIEENLSLLNFIPEIYSPNYRLVKNHHFVDSIRSLKMKLIPWTLNKPEDILRIMNLNVDGIITDYPERVLEIKKTTSSEVGRLLNNFYYRFGEYLPPPKNVSLRQRPLAY